MSFQGPIAYKTHSLRMLRICEIKLKSFFTSFLCYVKLFMTTMKAIAAMQTVFSNIIVSIILLWLTFAISQIAIFSV